MGLNSRGRGFGLPPLSRSTEPVLFFLGGKLKPSYLFVTNFEIIPEDSVWWSNRCRPRSLGLGAEAWFDVWRMVPKR